MKPIERYESMRAAVRALGSDGFVNAVLRTGRPRPLDRWEQLVEEARKRSRRSAILRRTFSTERGLFGSTSGPTFSLG